MGSDISFLNMKGGDDDKLKGGDDDKSSQNETELRRNRQPDREDSFLRRGVQNVES